MSRFRLSPAGQALRVHPPRSPPPVAVDSPRDRSARRNRLLSLSLFLSRRACNDREKKKRCRRVSAIHYFGCRYHLDGRDRNDGALNFDESAQHIAARTTLARERQLRTQIAIFSKSLNSSGRWSTDEKCKMSIDADWFSERRVFLR